MVITFKRVALMYLLACSGPGFAAYTVNVKEVEGNVVAEGSGTIRTEGLYSPFSGGTTAMQNGTAALLFLGILGPSSSVRVHVGAIGPTSFGSLPNVAIADQSSGDSVGINGLARMVHVPGDYVSGSPLSSSSTWLNASLDSLGLRPGTYEWHWGLDESADSFTLVIGQTRSPAPASSSEIVAVPTLAGWGWGLLTVLAGLLGRSGFRKGSPLREARLPTVAG